MKPRYLTKGRFKLASECPRKLYYFAHGDTYPSTKKDDDFLQALAEGGQQVGALARCYFPGGELISTLDYDDAVQQTNELLKRQDVIIYEAAIRHGNFFLRVDVLVKNGDEIELIEVKAKSYDPNETAFFGKRHPDKLAAKWVPYLDDIAFQTWVTRQAHPEWQVRPFLMLVDTTKVADVDGIHQLFRISQDSGVELTDEPTAQRLGRHLLAKVDMATEVEALIEGTAIDPAKDPLNSRPMHDRAEQYSAIYDNDERYKADLGAWCKKCEYRASEEELASGKKSGYIECWREQHGPDFNPKDPHVFDIWNFRNSDRLLANGIYRMADVTSGDLNDRQALQVDVTLGRQAGLEAISPQLFEEMDRWNFPLHFVDFETIMPAIPFHSGMHPYQNLAFQFSCHHLDSDGRVTHDEWLSTDAGEFPNWAFLVALRNSLGKSGTIFRYANHENTILNHLREQLQSECRPVPDGFDAADYCEWIKLVTKGGDRVMVDMCDLVRKHYYHRSMRGSNSIKAVLPAVLSDSKRLEELYAKPLEYGTNLKGMTLWHRDNVTGQIKNPYKLLPPLFNDIDPDLIDFLDGDGEIREGGAAMTAWARMQFCQMSQEERGAIAAGLLRYCELDTLAMLMIYQHWDYRRS